MDVNKKIEYIDSLYSFSKLYDSQIKVLRTLSCDANIEVRVRVSELLSLYPSTESEIVLLRLIKDKNYLVRASACDSLSWSSSVVVLDALIKATKDRSALVRGYSILSLADVQKNISCNATRVNEILEKLLTKEKSTWVKIALYRSLVSLGKQCYRECFIRQIFSKDYKNRCFTLSLLEELLDNNMFQATNDLLEFLQQAYEEEDTTAVKDKLLKLINRNN